mgnify:CR=1 FL=1
MTSQLSLFGEEPETPRVQTANLEPAVMTLAASLPPLLRLGTSSWTFPGWRGLVYRPPPRGKLSAEALAFDGLAAYAGHPLFRTVGIDRTYYAPIESTVFARYAGAVPADFRFLVKAHQALMFPSRPGRDPQDLFLSSAHARDAVIGPTLEGLRSRAGVILLQFPPLRLRDLGGAERVLERLHHFLECIAPSTSGQCSLAVELRNGEFFTGRAAELYRALLAETGTLHCYNLHPSVPTLEVQRAIIDPATQHAIVIRWMLRRNHQYEEAAEIYQPFDRLVEPDPGARADVALLCALAASLERPTWVIVNNKAEGSSPLTVLELAREVVRRMKAGPLPTDSA